MAAKGKEEGFFTALDKCEQSVECCLCEELKELRTLPCCQKLCCADCIEKCIFKSEKLECPFCFAKLVKNIQSFPVCKPIESVQKFLTALKDVLQKDEGENCSTPDCGEKIDIRCKQCKGFFCFRCRKLTCQTYEDQHDFIDLPDCVMESRELIFQWKTLKQNEIDLLEPQIVKVSAELRACGRQLADDDLSDLALCDLATKLTSRLEKSRAGLQRFLESKAQTESSMLMVKSLEGSDLGKCDIKLICLADQLRFYQDERKLSLGDYEPIIDSYLCYDVTWCSVTGELLVGRVGGVDVLDIRTLKTVRTLELENQYAFTIEPYKNLIIIGVENIRLPQNLQERNAQVYTFDSDYNMVSKWPAGRNVSDLTVVDDKVFITKHSQPNNENNIKVYTLNGEPLPEFLWNGRVHGIASVPPCSIVFSDSEHHRVYKQQITTGRRCKVWSANVTTPHCVHFADNGTIWIRSNANDCITILSREGMEYQRIMDEKVTKLGKIHDLCLQDGYLYFAHESGMGRFSVTYMSE